MQQRYSSSCNIKHLYYNNLYYNNLNYHIHVYTLQ